MLLCWLPCPVLRAHSPVISLLLPEAVALSFGDVAANSGCAVCSNKVAVFVGIDKHTTFLFFYC